MNTFTIEKPEIKLIGVNARTTNAAEAGPNGRLPGLWEAYFNSNVATDTRIMNSEFIYALYTDYESDANGAYTVVIGHEAGSTETEKSDNYNSAVIPASKYLVFTTKKGPVYEVVAQAWGEIWEYFQASSETRAFTGDFELYDARHFDPANTEVQIYIAIK
ncbi:Bacterial transcription activator, effector binding domain [compost metagenome]